MAASSLTTRGRTQQRSVPAFHVIYSRSPSRSMGGATSRSGPTSVPGHHAEHGGRQEARSQAH
eukprot:7519892-Alexandrium_andersonii.AAC.1